MTTFVIEQAMDYEHVRALKAAGEDFLLKVAGDAVFSLENVMHFDMAALALMLSWMRFAKAHQKKLTFKSIPASLKKMAALFGLGEVVG